MFLKKAKTRDGRIYLSIAEGYRANNKNRQRTVESLGYLDVLEEKYADPIVHFKEYARELTAKKREQNAKVALEFSPAEKIDSRSNAERLGLGSIPLSYCYHALQLDRFWNNRKVHANLAYDPNAVFRMLAYQRILRPGSKKDAYERAAELPDRRSFTLDQMYQSLSFFSKHEEAFKSHTDKALGAMRARDVSRAYYDVTNYYFEVENEDEAGLRRRGVSKEHRASPIVQMGLMMDSSGMPIDYELWSGNTVDCKTMLPAPRRVKDRHPNTRVVVVADKGLNTSSNIAEAVSKGDGFIFSQSVRRATKKLKAWVRDEAGYEKSASGNFKIKSRQAHKSIRVADDAGKAKTVKVDVQEIAFWSRDFFERARREREKVIEKSMRALEGGEVASARSKTGVRYVKDLAYESETGEAVSHEFSLDWDKVEADASLDGYYCIVTSECMMDEREVIEAYRELWRIEDTFRVTKSTLEVRPVFVWTESSIRAHFMTCYAALVMMRMLQDGLRWRYSADEIQKGLQSLVGYREDANWYLFANRSDATDAIGELLGVQLNRRRYTRGEIRQMMADSRKPGYGLWLKS